MILTWYGHACFRIEGRHVSILTDPFMPGTGHPNASGLPELPTFELDVVLMSSGDDDAHSWWKGVPGSPRIVNALDHISEPLHVRDDLLLTAFPTREGDDRPDWAGEATANAMYLFTVDGLSILHMGDIGVACSPDHLAALAGKVDVMLALAGGGLTIALDDLDAAIEAIDPRVVVPMHYKIPMLRYGVGPLEDFLAHRTSDALVQVDGCSVDLTPETTPSTRTTVVLRPLVLEGAKVTA